VAAPFPPLFIHPGTLTVSGVSAGAAMAVQFEFAHSGLIKGAAIVAGVPYQCAQGLLATALLCMSEPITIDVELLVYFASNLALLRLIDPIAHIAQHTVHLFSGRLDSIVSQGTMVQLEGMYQLLGAAPKSLFNVSAEHAWVTSQFGNPCPFLGSPFINNCGIDFAGSFLKDILTSHGYPWNSTRGQFDAASMTRFSQAHYGASPLLNALDDYGYAYIPQRCQRAGVRCHLHVNFHGCQQQASLIGTAYVTHTGLNEWAESNDVVVLYPQAISTILNPEGCFDWWGYTGLTYSQIDGAQISVVRSMIRALAGV
jgi:hypothetical protein